MLRRASAGGMCLEGVLGPAGGEGSRALSTGVLNGFSQACGWQLRLSYLLPDPERDRLVLCHVGSLTSVSNSLRLLTLLADPGVSEHARLRCLAAVKPTGAAASGPIRSPMPRSHRQRLP